MPWIHLHDLVELLATALKDERYRGAAIAAFDSIASRLKLAEILLLTLSLGGLWAAYWSPAVLLFLGRNYMQPF